ncbi:hypothetical protein SLEP1_g37390 [Rubroshorea leprosula]|uniref:Uncharacterized protein n=1 Tax=Rubroshorea leprosula TaxID=152421 RepID=A0AAV5KUM4_9ROSI|nr:hypothetical protein SLEP1_g37390 [Rubroshorea leprosula]
MADSKPSIFSSLSSSSPSPAMADSQPSNFSSSSSSSPSPAMADSSSSSSSPAMADSRPSMFSFHSYSSSSTAIADSQPFIFGTSPHLSSSSSPSTAMAGSGPFLFSSKSPSSTSRAQRMRKTKGARNQINAEPTSTQLATFSTKSSSSDSINSPIPNVSLPSSSSSVTKTLPELEKDSYLPLMVVSRILDGIPQDPHFYQLRNLSQLTRESLTSALDRVFEETVKQLYTLQVRDFWPKAKVLWKTMEDLQGMGYNVIVLRRRLVELTDVMVDLRQAKMRIKELRIKAEDHRLEKSRLKNIILNVQKMAEEEQERMLRLLTEAAKMEKELPNFDAEFVKLTMKPL